MPGHLCRDKDRTVRIRIAGQSAFITVKGFSKGATRAKFQYEIPPSDARQMPALCGESPVEMTRHSITYDGMLWEIDEFQGANAGLYDQWDRSRTSPGMCVFMFLPQGFLVMVACKRDGRGFSSRIRAAALRASS